MTITAIQRQVKNPDRYSVFVDGVYTFSLSSSALLASGLAVNDLLNPERLTELKEKSVNDKLYSSVLALIARRMRSRWEVEQYLKRKDVDENRATEILNTLSNQNYVNDYDFARAWVANRRLLKQISFRKLRLELMAKHVHSDVINEILDADETNENDVLIELIRKKRSIARYQDDQKLMQYLTRQGFGYQDIKNAFLALGEE